MDEQTLLCVRLRERAAHCRELARDASLDGLARELESIAEEYERDADGLEAGPRLVRERPAA